MAKRTETSRLTATLARGMTYVYGGKTFTKGVPVEVTKEERTHLQENAIDYVTLPARTDDELHENRAIQKFTFSEETPA